VEEVIPIGKVPDKTVANTRLKTAYCVFMMTGFLVRKSSQKKQGINKKISSKKFKKWSNRNPEWRKV
jgi:hypothetical protein